MFNNRYMYIGIKQVTHFKLQSRNISRFGRGINFFFKKNLLLTNTLTSGICMGLGDIIEQEHEYQQGQLAKRYDWKRLARMFVMGMGKGPVLHYYYLQIDSVLPKYKLKTVILKILIDQVIASPIMIFYFFYTIGILEQKSIPDITTEIKQKFFYLYTRDCIYWPPIQFINFYFLPPEYRVVYLNVASMVYNIFLSYVKYYY